MLFIRNNNNIYLYHLVHTRHTKRINYDKMSEKEVSKSNGMGFDYYE